MVKKALFLLLILFVGKEAWSTHYRAGEIYYQQLTGRVYRITATTFTDPSSAANQFTTQLTLFWGDGTSNVVPRTKLEAISSTVQKNTYVFDHAYGSDGVFIINFSDPNRVAGIKNINNGINTDGIPFYVESLIRISETIGNNQSPILTVPPVVDGCVDYFYFHNPGAYDPDGDSLVFSLDIPKKGRNEPVDNYFNPAATDSFSIDSRTGKVYWVKPMDEGLYNIAIKVTEYRNGKVVGYVVRDMQIKIKVCINNPPTLENYAKRCAIAGDSISFDIKSIDTDGNSTQRIRLFDYGGPFSVPNSPALLNPLNPIGIGSVTARFLWKTNCTHIRYAEYMGTIEAIDDYSTPLANYTSLFIQVIPPKPSNFIAKQIGNGFQLSWDKDICGLANGYKIYRKIDSSFWNPGVCEKGIPASTGFQLIGTIQGNVHADTDTAFYDDDKGEGLSPLIRYCYRLVAIFPSRSANGNVIGGIPSESVASIEICDAIIRSKPVVTEVSVRNTDMINGSLKLSWLRPDTLDTAIYTQPYRLVFKRAINGESPLLFTTFATADYPTFASIVDSSLIDSNLNTLNSQFIYKIELLWDSAGIPTFVDVSPTASSLYTNVYSTDNTNILSWKAKVPWTNTQYKIYRQNKTNLQFDSIATTSKLIYPDTGLINGVEYCYFVSSSGAYSFIQKELINLSQKICGTPIDTVKPCAPKLTVIPPCDVFNNFTNQLKWVPNKVCGNDVLWYKIYYKKLATDTFRLLAVVDRNTLSYSDTSYLLRFSIAGCYAVNGVDSFLNESNFTSITCIDNCPFYQIPNVFTPNGSGPNELLKPFPYRFIEKIHLKIFNRWGQLVFQTDELDINWDGTDQTNGKDLTDGVYFYTCDVYQQYLNGLKVEKLNGTVQIIR